MQKKQYSFLNESAIMTAIGAAGLGMGAWSLWKSHRQHMFTKKYIKLMIGELNNCNPNDRQSALNIVNKYSQQLSQMYNMMDKKTVNKIQATQNFINLNFRIPLMKIINNPNDVNWKQNSLTFVKKNMFKINVKHGIGTAAAATGMAAGGALMTGVGGAAAAATSVGLFTVNTAIKQLKIFNSTRYINKMSSEIQQLNDADRQGAINIINRYCYDISNNIQSIVNKTGKKINFNIQMQMRNQFLIPMMQIINNQNNKFWKITVLDFIKEQKCQQIIQHVCDTITQLILPRIMKRNNIPKK